MTITAQFKRQSALSLSLTALLLTLTACGGGTGNTGSTDTGTNTNTNTNTTQPATSDLSGDVMIDGSSTVFPISEAMAEEFMKANSNVKVTVGVSGTGGGFKKFCAGETDISNASRPIKKSEIELCQQNGIEYIEVPVAFDGLSVVANTQNNWATCLKPEELSKMWEPAAEGKITKWNQIRPDFPDKNLGLYGPGTDSGTYDYFTDAITGKEGESRGDFTASEDDNVIVQGVEADEGALGFFGFAYYEENKDKLKIIEIENKEGKCIIPTVETISDGTYNPLSRPIFFYVSKKVIESKPAVKAFAEYNLDPTHKDLITEVGYVPLPEDIVAKVKTRLDSMTLGSIFGGESSVGVKLSDKL